MKKLWMALLAGLAVGWSCSAMADVSVGIYAEVPAPYYPAPPYSPPVQPYYPAQPYYPPVQPYYPAQPYVFPPQPVYVTPWREQQRAWRNRQRWRDEREREWRRDHPHGGPEQHRRWQD